MKHIVSFSGGKDSTAMLLMMIERGMKLDDIVYFDCGDWEFPQMHEHIRQVERYIGREITRLYPPHGDFSYWMFDRIVTRVKKGNTSKTGKAWPGPVLRWCTGCKVETIDKYHRQYKEEGMISYIGFAADEINRMIRPNISKRWHESRFPLYDFDMTEADCLEYCYNKGFTWGGSLQPFQARVLLVLSASITTRIETAIPPLPGTLGATSGHGREGLEHIPSRREERGGLGETILF